MIGGKGLTIRTFAQKPEAIQRASPGKSAALGRPFAAQDRDSDSARPCTSFSFSQVRVSRPSQPTFAESQPSHGGSTRSGRAPGETEDTPGLLGGVLDTLRDVGNVVSTGAGNLVGGVAAALTGVDIDTADTHAANWTPHGAFMWHVTWNMTGRKVGATTNGWVVQNIENTYDGEDSHHGAITTARVGATPSYYEAWPVVGGAVRQPWGGASDDTWGRPDLSVWHPVADAHTHGRWSMLGKAYFTTTDPTAHGLAPHNVPDAGDLPSAATAPPDLGVARLHRFANGTWDSTGPLPRHSGGHR